MLWCDKYRPTEFEDLDYHQEQARALQHITRHGDFPHLLLYGPLGAGKKTRIMCLLKELYGPGVEKLKLNITEFQTPSNKKLDINTLTSNYHIEVNPADVGIYDRIVIMNIIKTAAQTHQINANAQRDFKVIVLTDVDQLTKAAQHALRRTMEKYMNNCRLILCAQSISRVLPPIRSRCLCIRVAAPSANTIQTILQSIAKDNQFADADDSVLKQIVQHCDRNLRRAILMLEQYYVAQKNASQTGKTINDSVLLPDWLQFIRKSVAARMLQSQTLRVLSEIREAFYELLVNNLSGQFILNVLLDELLDRINDDDVAAGVVQLAGLYEHRMQLGGKEIIHLEAFVAKFMCLYQKMMQDLLSMDF